MRNCIFFALLASLVVFAPQALTQNQPSPAGGGWLEFPKKDSFVEAEDANSLGASFFKEGVTIEAWLYLPDVEGNWDRLVIASKPGCYLLSLNPNGVDVWAQMAVNVATGFRLPYREYIKLGEWHYVAAQMPTGKPGDISLFIDGSQVMFFAREPILLAESKLPFVIGKSISGFLLNPHTWISGDSPFYGFIDEVRLSDVLRYERNFPVPKGQLVADVHTVALWHFNESEGTTLFGDSSGNGNTLIGRNGAKTIGGK